MGYDAVRKPSHYVEGRKFEPKDVIRDWGLNFNLGNAVKYLSRAGRKGDIIEDLRKAQEYIQFEIDALEAEGKKVTPSVDHSYCKCVSKPVTEKKCGVIELVVPKDMPMEEVIQMAIAKIMG